MAMPFAYASPEQVMKDKADYARKGIARGKAVVALEYQDGVLFVAENGSATLHKISEIYDRVGFAGVGKFNEYESLRIAGIRHAELKGFSYSRSDVNARALANMYSSALGQAFTDAMKPFEVEILVAQVGESNELYRVSFDGHIIDQKDFIAMGGASDDIAAWLTQRFEPGLDFGSAFRLAIGALTQEGSREVPTSHLEVAKLDRNLGRRKFARLSTDEVEALRS